MKILFIVPYPTEGPSIRFRVEQYFGVLKDRGVAFKIRPFCDTHLYRILHRRGFYFIKIFRLVFAAIARLMDVFRAMNYDIVFIHREAFPDKSYVFEWLFRLFAKKIVYDFDDSVFLTKPAKVRKILAMADYVIAGNRFLKEYACRFNKNIAVIPTPIDTEKYFPQGAVSRRDGKLVIGWMGTSSTSVYLKDIENVFKHLSGKYGNIEFRIIGGQVNFRSAIPVSRIDWSLGTEVNELRQFDIGIMPMPDNNWTKGKCAFKIIQYMAVGIPSVASPVGMNRDVIDAGSNGFLAEDEKVWCDRLSELIESPSLRKAIGEAGRQTVEEKYSLKVNAPKFLDVLTKVAADRR